MTRFLGDTPLRVAVRLLILSLITGFVMNWFGIYPIDLWDWLVDSVRYVYDRGFVFFENWLHYLALGAAVVVPIFLLSRILKYRSRPRPPLER